MRSDEQISPSMGGLSKYIAGALKRKLPAEVVERAKLHLVDTFAAMISGSRLLPGKRAVAYIKPLGGIREAGIVGTRFVTSARYAALANGMCWHSDESDDTHPATRSHPGVSVVPAILAMAERQQLSGEAILRALVLGYDICARILFAFNAEHLSRSGQNASSKGGLFGAAAGAAAMLNLDARKVRYVLSYCAQQAAGLFTTVRDTQHIEKAYVLGGMPAYNGVTSALMVASGFSGVEDVLSGEPNLMSVFSRGGDREALVRGLGRDYEILRCGIKYWPAAGGIQGPLHVLRDLIRQHGIKADDVEKLVVRMPNKELDTVNNRDMPGETVQHMLALMLFDGTVTFASAHDYERMKDARILKFRQRRIEAIGDAKLTDPLRRWRCVMEITLKDGRKLIHQTMASQGTFENPLTRQEAQEKALDLMAPVLGKQRSRTLMAALFGIENIENARALRKLYFV